MTSVSKPPEYKKLLSEEIPKQSLSVVTALTKKQKERIVSALAEGKFEFEKLSGDTIEDLKIMRKFATILLRDITKGRKSLVRQEFSSLLTIETETQIKSVFANAAERLDDDINVTVDQTLSLAAEIKRGAKYPAIDENGFIDRNELRNFLEKLCKVFRWEVHEGQTLGYVGRNGKHGKLEWYAVILSQWMQGNGLQFIMEHALRQKSGTPDSVVYINNQAVPFVNQAPHRNVVIADTLQVIEKVILFSLSNYFLRFSDEYKRQHGNKPFTNDWYEFVEYGTTNPLSIMLQRNGFFRETANFIKDNRRLYVVTENGEAKLRRALAECGNISVENEVRDVMLNVPELFVD
jgi:hypothetical protein